MKVCKKCNNLFSKPKNYGKTQWKKRIFCSHKCFTNNNKGRLPKNIKDIAGWNKNKKLKPLSKEHKLKISLATKGGNKTSFKKGIIAWNKGKKGLYKLTIETRKKMSISRSGKNHPMYGKKHSKETKMKISKNNAMKGKLGELNHNFGKHHSEETKQKMSDKKVGKLPKHLKKVGKYGNIIRGYFDINGKKMFFRSKWEANYALYLDFLIKQKEIKKWEYEKETFWFLKIKRGIRSYTPDFKVITNNNLIEYHEVKGWMDNKSKTKLKRIAKYYPEIKLILIDKDVYYEIKKKVGRMLNFY